LAAASRYLYVGISVLVVAGATAGYLNFQGVACLTDLARIDRSVAPGGLLEEMERNCALVTNSYVYSLYAVAAGVILVIAGYMKKRKGNAS
jgi:hypothetical protein